MQMFSFVVAIAVIMCNLDNRVASRPFRPNPVPGDTQEQIQPGAQLHCSMAGCRMLTGSITRLSTKVQPGVDSDPELISLYIQWRQWE